MNLDTLTQAVSDGFSRLKAALSISQHQRLMQLETALASATLVVERAQWNEDVSGLGPKAHPLSPLLATVDCLSTSAHLELKALIGEQMSLRLMCSDGRYRTWHGYVAQAAQLGSDGGLAHNEGADYADGLTHGARQPDTGFPQYFKNNKHKENFEEHGEGQPFLRCRKCK